MRTTEPERWQALLDKVAALSPKILAQLEKQELFELLGHKGTLSDKARYSTVEGLNRQLDDFTDRRGLVYYIDEDVWGMSKTAFEKTREEHYR